MRTEPLLPVTLTLCDQGQGQTIIHLPHGVHLLAGSETALVYASLSRAHSLDDAWSDYDSQCGTGASLSQEAFMAHARHCLDVYTTAKADDEAYSWSQELLKADYVERVAGYFTYLFLGNRFYALVLIALLTLVAIAANFQFEVVRNWMSDANWWMISALFVASVVAHEFGHAAALMSYGQRPGAMGIGIMYTILPVFYVNLGEAWRLPRHHRCVVNAAGVVMQLLVAGVYFLTGILLGFNESILLAAALVSVIALVQLVPLVRSDGFWLLADALNEPRLGQMTLSDARRLHTSFDVRQRRRAFWIGLYVVSSKAILLLTCILMIHHLYIAAPYYKQWALTGDAPTFPIIVRTALACGVISVVFIAACKRVGQWVVKARHYPSLPPSA